MKINIDTEQLEDGVAVSGLTGRNDAGQEQGLRKVYCATDAELFAHVQAETLKRTGVSDDYIVDILFDLETESSIIDKVCENLGITQ